VSPGRAVERQRKAERPLTPVNVHPGAMTGALSAAPDQPPSWQFQRDCRKNIRLWKHHQACRGNVLRGWLEKFLSERNGLFIRIPESKPGEPLKVMLPGFSSEPALGYPTTHVCQRFSSVQSTNVLRGGRAVWHVDSDRELQCCDLDQEFTMTCESQKRALLFVQQCHIAVHDGKGGGGILRRGDLNNGLKGDAEESPTVRLSRRPAVESAPLKSVIRLQLHFLEHCTVQQMKGG